MKDLTPGTHDVPPFSLGGPDDYAISPDSTEVAFTMNVDAESGYSAPTRISYTVPIAGGEPKKITISPGADDAPLYSPDGKYLAFRSQARAGYESDRWRLMVLERATGRTINLSEGLDRWVGSMTWSPDSTRLFFTVEDRGRTGLQMIAVTGGGSRNIIFGRVQPGRRAVQLRRQLHDLHASRAARAPRRLYRASSTGGTGVALTHLNDALLANSTHHGRSKRCRWRARIRRACTRSS